MDLRNLKLPTLEKFWFCIDLRIGAIVKTVLEISLNTFLIVLVCTYESTSCQILISKAKKSPLFPSKIFPDVLEKDCIDLLINTKDDLLIPLIIYSGLYFWIYIPTNSIQT